MSFSLAIFGLPGKPWWYFQVQEQLLTPSRSDTAMIVGAALVVR